VSSRRERLDPSVIFATPEWTFIDRYINDKLIPALQDELLAAQTIEEVRFTAGRITELRDFEANMTSRIRNYNAAIEAAEKQESGN